MCGIIGFLNTSKNETTKENAIKHTLEGLKSLEYRGYDSAGITFPCPDNKEFITIKSVGNVDRLVEKVELFNNSSLVTCHLSLGHTRWATHGGVSEINAHPHISHCGRIVVVHNGIISNHQEIRKSLADKGIIMKSQTDTEVIPNLISLFLKKQPSDNNSALLQAVKRATDYLHGSFAFLAIEIGTQSIVATRKGRQPLTIGNANGFHYITSDIPAAQEKCKTLYALEDNEFAEVTRSGITFYNKDNNQLKAIQKKPLSNIKKVPKPSKGEFATFMEKEIFEIPSVIRRIGKEYDKISATSQFQDAVNLLRKCDTVHIAACGTAYHAGLMLGMMLESTLKKRTKVYIASEMPYQNPLISKKDIGIVISQSGETADTLSALQLMKERNLPTIGICNVEGSSISRYVDYFLPTLAGTEVAVASTKAYIAQVMVGTILTNEAVKTTKEQKLQRECCNTKQQRTRIHRPPETWQSKLVPLAKQAQELLKSAPGIKMLAKQYRDANRIFFLGKNMGVITALESALKVKEITYKHCEGFPAGELKHGTLSLVDQNTLTIIFRDPIKQPSLEHNLVYDVTHNTQDNVSMREKLDNARAEVEARGSHIWEITGNPTLSAIPAQLFALYIAEELSLNPDQPRNLAKSVTVH